MKFIAIILSIIIFSACSEDNNPNNLDNDSANSTTIQVTDFRGDIVSLKKPAERIIALAPHIVENVFTAGAGDQLIGVVTYSDYPEQAKSLPVVGGYTKVNLEKVVELNPDLVIAWQSNNSDESVAQIKQLGFSVYVDQPKTLEDVAKSIRDIGALSGQTDQASLAADDYLAKINGIKVEQENVKPVTSFYQVWNNPLQTLNGDHIISAAIEICGGVNIYANETAIAPIINIESILDKNPDVIIASGMSDSRPEWLDEWHQWPSLKAVQEDNLFFVEPDHIQRHTIRILLGIESICSQLNLARQRQTIQ